MYYITIFTVWAFSSHLNMLMWLTEIWATLKSLILKVAHVCPNLACDQTLCLAILKGTAVKVTCWIDTIILPHSPVATKFQWKMIEKNLKHVQLDLDFVWKRVLFCSTKPKFSFVDNNNYCPFYKEKISFAALKCTTSQIILFWIAIVHVWRGQKTRS